jgi:cytochrome d ubiquinol oxidase subunit I
MSINAYYILKGRHLDIAKRGFTIALAFGTLFSLAALLTGHSNANMVAKHQPAKLAAFEGHFQTGSSGAPLYLFGWPNETEKRVDYGVKIPGMLSFLIHNDFSTPVPGLDQFPKENHPPIKIPFLTYHIMISLGMTFIGLTLLSCYFWWKGTLFSQKWLMRTYVFAVIGPYLANQAGWVAAEVGRQPWIVYGLLRTSEAHSKAVSANMVLSSIILFGLIYSLLFFVWVYILNEKIQHGPDDVSSSSNKPNTGILDAAIVSTTELKSGK